MPDPRSCMGSLSAFRPNDVVAQSISGSAANGRKGEDGENQKGGKVKRAYTMKKD